MVYHIFTIPLEVNQQYNYISWWSGSLRGNYAGTLMSPNIVVILKLDLSHVDGVIQFVFSTHVG